jgi:transcriptional regulator with XRE-family HTH domain
MELSGQVSDRVVLEELGRRMAAQRVAHNLTQAELSERAGVSKRTVERLEAGESTQLSSFIRVLRSLGLIDRLESLLPGAQPGPMDLLKYKGKERKRARSKKDKEKKKPWAWGDEV